MVCFYNLTKEQEVKKGYNNSIILPKSIKNAKYAILIAKRF